MIDIEKSIVPFIEAQFPEFYREEGARFIDFVKAYYSWLEQEGQQGDVSRNLMNIRDIDHTKEEFKRFFVSKYLKQLPLTTEANTRFLVKHASDIYRTKGTAEGVELVIKGLFNQESSIYRPAEDLFKTSSGHWIKPVYLELSPSPRTKDFVGREIIGADSLTKAFVETLVTRRIGERYIDVAYLSNVRGDFVTGEFITTTANTNVYLAPKTTGSMTSLSVLDGGAEFKVGDIFNVESTSGKQGLARVNEISNQTGKVSFIFIDSFVSGGWGYSQDHTNVMISDRVLTVKNLYTPNTEWLWSTDSGVPYQPNKMFQRLETLSQPMANIVFSSSNVFPNSDILQLGTNIEQYYGNGSVAGTGVLIQNGLNFFVVYNTYGSLNNNVKLVVTPNKRSLSLSPTANVGIFDANGGISNTTRVLTVSRDGGDHNFANGDVVVYRVLTGNTAIAQLSDGGSYFVVNTTSTTLQLANTVDNTVINVESGLTESGHVLQPASGSVIISQYNDRSANGIIVGSNVTSKWVAIDTKDSIINAEDKIQPYTHSNYSYADPGRPLPFVNNDLIFVASSNWSSSFLPSGLTGNSWFYVANTTNTSFQVTSTLGGEPIDLTKATNSTLIKLYNYTGYVGVSNILHPFVTSSYSNVIGLTSNIVASVANVSTGTGAGFSIGPLAYPETVYLTPDFLSSNNANDVIFHSIKLTGNNSGAGLQYVTPTALSSDAHGQTGLSANGGFGFVKFPAGNLDSILIDCLRFDATIIGSITSIHSVNPGSDYNVDPFVLVHDPWVSGYNHHDYIMRISDPYGAFQYKEEIQQSYETPGVQLTFGDISFDAMSNGSTSNTVFVSELIYQSNLTTNAYAKGYLVEGSVSESANSGVIKLRDVVGTFTTTDPIYSLSSKMTADTVTDVDVVTITTVARALVKRYWSAPRPLNAPPSSPPVWYFLDLKRINLEDTFIPNSEIVGRATGSTANVVAWEMDKSVDPIGLNAVIEANVQTANSVVTDLTVFDSGYGYRDKEVVTLTSANSNYVVTAVVTLGKQGSGAGYYESTDGFLDSNKKLYDGDYYQDFSYEVQTKIPFVKYFDVLKQITHPIGNKMFGKVVLFTNIDEPMNVTSSITITP